MSLKIEEVKLLKITIKRGRGTNDDPCRPVEQYFKKCDDGNFVLLFEVDPCKEKE